MHLLRTYRRQRRGCYNARFWFDHMNLVLNIIKRIEGKTTKRLEDVMFGTRGDGRELIFPVGPRTHAIQDVGMPKPGGFLAGWWCAAVGWRWGAFSETTAMMFQFLQTHKLLLHDIYTDTLQPWIVCLAFLRISQSAAHLTFVPMTC